MLQHIPGKSALLTVQYTLDLLLTGLDQLRQNFMRTENIFDLQLGY